MLHEYEYGLKITELGNNEFIVENDINKLVGICYPIDDYRTQVKLKNNYTKGKNGRLYESKKLIKHNASWFYYILQKYDFVREAKTINE
jgi:hypothetical protein